MCVCDGETGEDVSDVKDEGVVRSQLKKGEGYMTPKEGATCEGIVRHFVIAISCLFLPGANGRY